jgi:hypothetical protein
LTAATVSWDPSQQEKRVKCIWPLRPAVSWQSGWTVGRRVEGGRLTATFRMIGPFEKEICFICMADSIMSTNELFKFLFNI